METIIIDSNNCFITLAQGMYSDPASRHAVSDLDSVRKMILVYVGRLAQKGNDIVLAVDNGTWRKDYYPEYKANRGKEKERSDFPYPVFMDCFKKVIEELKGVGGKVCVVQAEKAEGDDVVAILAPLLLPVVIHSSDQDLLQLQTYHAIGVRQFSPRDWKFMTCEEKSYDIFDHIIRGDAGDGVPNVLSDDRCFVDKIRQVPMIKSRYEELYSKIATPDPEGFIGDDAELMRRYYRNKLMVDLREIPQDVRDRVHASWKESRQERSVKFADFLARYGVMV